MRVSGWTRMKSDIDIATDVDTSFDEHISLRNLKGQEDIVSMLSIVSEQFLNDQIAGRNPDYPSVILFGKEGSGRRTIARAMHNYLGQIEFKHAHAHFGGIDDDIFRFWQGNEHTTHFVDSVDNLNPHNQIQICRLLKEHTLRVVLPIEKREEVIEVPNRLIIFSASNADKLVPHFLSEINIHCYMTEYSVGELFEILKQRCDLAHWQYDKDVLDVIAAGCKDNPAKAIRLLMMSYRCMRSKNAENEALCLEDVETAIRFISPAKK